MAKLFAIETKNDAQFVKTKTRKWNKGMLKTGSFNFDGNHQDFDENRLEKMAKTANEMIKNGTQIPILDTHDWKNSAKHTLGYAKNFKVKNGWLDATYEFADDEAERVALVNNQVSVAFNTEYTTTEGQQYVDAIRHIAITPVPRIPGQDEGFRIAAAEDNTVVLLSYGEDMDLKQFLNELFPDNTVEEGKELDFLRETITSLRAQSEPVALAENNELIKARTNICGERIDHLVRTHRMDRARATELKEIVSQNRIALSENSENYMVSAILDVLEKMPVRVELGSRTGLQGVAIPDEKKDAQPVNGWAKFGLVKEKANG